MALEADQAALRRTASQLAQLGPALHAALTDRLEADVANPLAQEVARSWAGPWASALAAGTTTTTIDGHPAITVGGSAPAVSGGASVAQLVYGALGGGSGRNVPVGRRTRRGGRARYQIRAGVQFDRHHRDTLTPALARAADQLDTAVLAIIDDTIQETLP